MSFYIGLALTSANTMECHQHTLSARLCAALLWSPSSPVMVAAAISLIFLKRKLPDDQNFGAIRVLKKPTVTPLDWNYSDSTVMWLLIDIVSIVDAVQILCVLVQLMYFVFDWDIFCCFFWFLIHDCGFVRWIFKKLT